MPRKSREKRRPPDAQRPGPYASPAMQAALQLYLPPEDSARRTLPGASVGDSGGAGGEPKARQLFRYDKFKQGE